MNVSPNPSTEPGQLQSNPDTGLITARFDLMGNRVGLTEPNHRAAGVEVRYQFDRDRLAAVDYPSKPDVAFVYGAAGASNFAAGRLVQVTDETGTQQHKYGALGELRRTIRTVVPAQQGSQSATFDLRLTSDSFGRQLRIGYPDGEVVTNTYDAAGMLSGVSGVGTGWTQSYVTNLEYDEFGHRTRARFGNGVESRWEFDPQRLRLATIKTTLPGAGALKIQDLVYSYDPASNPTQIINQLAALSGGSGNQPGDSTLTLTYDGVDRLTRAVGSAQLNHQKRTTYDETFAYSPSHNITSKARVHQIVQQSGSASTPPSTNFTSAYSYTTSRPHLPSQIGDLAITYDPSGNPITRQRLSTGSTQNLVWDDDGRMVDVIQTGGNQHSTYDASGTRVRRKNTEGDTIFSSPYFDSENSTLGVKHVFAGNLRIASKLGKFVSGPNPIADNKVGTAYFFHADHLGSTGVLTDTAGAVVQSLEYFVDGETWIDRAPQKLVNGYLFTGKPVDAATGFYDFGQRFYDPRTSLFLGGDPLASDEAAILATPRTLAVSSYAHHTPVRLIDPDGRAPWVPTQFNVPTLAESKVALAAEGLQRSTELAWRASREIREIAKISRLTSSHFDVVEGALHYLDTGCGGWCGVRGEKFDAKYSIGTALMIAATVIISRGAPTRVRGNGLDYEVGGGADAGAITPGQRRRIQNAANKIQRPISLVGSRASGTSGPESDWDYTIDNSNARLRGKVKNSLPGAEDSPRGLAGGTNVEIFKAPTDKTRPYIQFYPVPKDPAPKDGP